MNQRVQDGQVYAPSFSPGSRQSASRTPTDGLPQSTLPAPQTLPPLTQTGQTPSVHHDSFNASRVQPLQPSLMSAPSDPVHQPGSFPVYGPTANTYYNSPTACTTPSSTSLQPAATSYTRTTTALQDLPYTSSTSSPLRLPEIQPMPSISNGRVNKSISFAGRNGSSVPALPTEEESHPTHVVGSQGRRGILPSAEGRPKADTNGTAIGQKSTPALAKSADGKFPCPHCTKDYLHAKHLKRHMLRRKSYPIPACCSS